MKNEKLIVILGMHRSGTSSITRGLQVLNVNIGNRLLPPLADNRKGFWEDIDIVALDVEMLHTVKSDWHYIAPIKPADVEVLHQKGYFLRAVELLRAKVGHAPVFAFKDPRVTKLLPFWKDVFKHCEFDIQYVIATRHPLSVVKSLKKRNGFDEEKSYFLWLEHSLLSLSGTSDEKRVFIDFDRLLQNPDHEMHRIANCFDLRVDPARLEEFKTEFLEQGLRHTTYKRDDLFIHDVCPPIVREVYFTLLELADDTIQMNNPIIHKKLKSWENEFNRFSSLMTIVDRLFWEKETLAAESGKQVVNLKKVVAERETQIASLNQAVAARDGQIAVLTTIEKKVDQILRRIIGNSINVLSFLRFKKATKRHPLLDKNWYLEEYKDVRWGAYYHYHYFGVIEGRNPNPYFDTCWYLKEYQDVAQTGINPLLHYIQRGCAEGRNPCPYFDTRWYLSEYPDVAQSGMNPLLHFIKHGVEEGRNPNPFFDTRWYLSEYPDVAQSGMNPLLHFIKRGVEEGRNPNPYFDTRWYLSEYPDVAQTGMNPLLHFIKHGVEEGRNPNPYFDTRWYLSEYPDVAQSGINPLQHYMKYGVEEGTNPSPYLHTCWYLNEYPDVARNGINPLFHYIKYGIIEGKSPNPYFDAQWYLNTYPEVASFGINPLFHYLIQGASEGKSPNPIFDIQWYLTEYPDAIDTSSSMNPLLHYLKNGAKEGKRMSFVPNIPGYEQASNGVPSCNYMMLHAPAKDEQLLCFDLILVTYNSSKWVDACLISLQQHDKYLKITVIDNGSTDDTITRLESHRHRFESLNIIQNESNVGFGVANNRGAKETNSNYLFFLNIDTELNDAETFLKLCNIITASKNDAAVWEFRQLPYEHPKCYDPVTLETSWFSGAAVIVKREAFEKVGGFDEKLFMYCEDVDLSWRIRAIGYRLLYCPSITVTHHCYDNPGELKPIAQLYGAMHNYFLRNRFGDEQDKIIGKDLLCRFTQYAKKNLQPSVYKKLCDTEEMSTYFRTTRCESNSFFRPFFNRYDYEITREGSFFPCLVSQPDSKVSVIVRTIGRLHYLERAIYSIINQTYGNIEIVIIEDGSNKAKELLEKFKDFNIEYKTIEKVGRCRAGNIGLETATGDFFNFLDEDDLLYCDHIETLVNAISEKPDCGAVWSSAFCVATEEAADKKNYFERNYTLGHTEEPDCDSIFKVNFCPIQAVLFRRECYEKLGGFDPEMDFLEDWDLWIKFFKHYKFSRVAKTTSLYRVPFDKDLWEERKNIIEQYYDTLKRKYR